MKSSCSATASTLSIHSGSEGGRAALSRRPDRAASWPWERGATCCTLFGGRTEYAGKRPVKVVKINFPLHSLRRSAALSPDEPVSFDHRDVIDNFRSFNGKIVFRAMGNAMEKLASAMESLLKTFHCTSTLTLLKAYLYGSKRYYSKKEILMPGHATPRHKRALNLENGTNREPSNA